MQTLSSKGSDADYPNLVFDPDSRRVARLAAILRHHGLSVAIAYNPTEVLQSVKNAYFQTMVVTVDLESSEGLQFLDALRSSALRSWLLVTSKHIDRAHEDLIHRHGADALIDYSVSFEEVARRVELLQVKSRPSY